MMRRLVYAFAAGLLVLIIGTTGWSFAADNIVAPSMASDTEAPITMIPTPITTPTPAPTPTSTPAPTPTPPSIPLACVSLGITNYIVITGNGAIHGTDGNDLIFGSTGQDNIHAGAGNDCIVGGGGADQIFGDAGFDVCIGSGDSKEQFHDCEVIIP